MARFTAVLACLALFCAMASAQRTYRFVKEHDITGQDLRSKTGTPYIKFCTPTSGGYKGKYGFDAFKLACDDTPGCVAFTAPKIPDGCAYLKSKGTRAEMKPDPNWVVQTTQEKEQKACIFSQLGGFCNTNEPWVDQPYCCGGNKNPCVNGKCVSGYPRGH